MPPYTEGAHEVADGVLAYTQPNGGWGLSNGGLVAGAERSLLIETLSDLAHTRRMLDALGEAGRAAPGIETVVNTHSNPDHCWGNQLVAGSAEIIASRAAAQEMLQLQPEVLRTVKASVPPDTPEGRFFELLFGSYDFSDVVVTPPTRTFEGALTLDLGGVEVQLREVGPAHTKGDVIVHIPSAGVVFTGDIVFAGAHPIMWDGPVANWIAACDTLLELGARTVVPGHGPIGDDTSVRDMREYLVYVEREARGRFDAGMDVLDAAYDIHLEAFAGWLDQERIVVTVNSLYREFGSDQVVDAEPELLSAMARYRFAHDQHAH